MAQDDYAIANAAGATVRADINAQLAAIVSLNSGAAAPAPTFAGMWWYDTTNDIFKKRNEANTAFIELIHFDQTAGLFRIDFDKGADIASAATTDIWAATGNSATITGVVTITSLGTGKAGSWRLIRFAGALLLTHNAVSLILPGGANITTAAGDMMLVLSEGGSNARVAIYQKADGTPLVAGPATGSLIGFRVFSVSGTWTPTAGTVSAEVKAVAGGGGGGGANGSGVVPAVAGGGGAGEMAIKRITSFGATETVTIGAGGAAGAATPTDGGVGGTTSLGTLVTAIGGSGGVSATTGEVRRGGIGGTGGTGSDLAIPGQGGGTGGLRDTTEGTGGNGGGDGGGAGGQGLTGSNGARGGGGGGAGSISNISRAGGAGGAGYIIIREYS